MFEPISIADMRACDAATIKKLGNSRILMYRAGEAVCSSVDFFGRIAIICGTGNNAGDGYVIAQLLHNQGMTVHIYHTENKFSPDGKYYYDICKQMDIPSMATEEGTDFSSYDFIIDCIYGTGFHGEVPEFIRAIIQHINASPAYVVSVDINSGMNGDTGLSSSFVHSDLTVSIGFYKFAHMMPECRAWMKKLVNANIGIEKVVREKL